MLGLDSGRVMGPESKVGTPAKKSSAEVLSPDSPGIPEMDLHQTLAKLIDQWCERRALRPLRMLLPFWPPSNGFTSEWQEVWAAMRHIRAMCREELAANGESEDVHAVVAELSRQLFANRSPQDIEQLAEQITAAIFVSQSA